MGRVRSARTYLFLGHSATWRAGIRHPPQVGAMAGRRRVQGNGMLLMLALHAASQFLQLQRKPPVTAGLILANVLVYLRPGALDETLPLLHEVCLNPHLVLRDLDLKRLVFSAFYHVDEQHLVYNMLSLLWKGVQLEGRMGSKRFASMVAALLGMSQSLMVLLAKLMSMLGDSPGPLYSQCAVGFSGVLFALKVVLNHNSPENTSVYGVVVPARYAAWAELILVQMFVPGTSFLGHLCGILAGLIYVHAPRFLSRSNAVPWCLRRWANWSWMVVTRVLLGRPSHPRYGRGVAGSSSSMPGRSRRGLNNAVWRCPVCTYDNLEALDACDMCGTPRAGSGSNGSPSAPPWPQGEPLPDSSSLSLEELRRARLARFS